MRLLSKDFFKYLKGFCQLKPMRLVAALVASFGLISQLGYADRAFASSAMSKQRATQTAQVKGEVMTTHELTLYYKPTCPYCKKVIEYMDSAGVIIPMEDTSDHEKAAELIHLGGKKQVPCLVINGKALYESDAIIDWLKANGDKTEFEV